MHGLLCECTRKGSKWCCTYTNTTTNRKQISTQQQQTESTNTSKDTDNNANNNTGKHTIHTVTCAFVYAILCMHAQHTNNNTTTQQHKTNKHTRRICCLMVFRRVLWPMQTNNNWISSPSVCSPIHPLFRRVLFVCLSCVVHLCIV